MIGDDGGSVSRWLGDLQAGDQGAAQPLWDRYFDRLVRLASAKLRAGRTSSAEADEEDAALSAFDSFCAGAARGRFPDLSDRDDLWRLLVVITARKVQAQARRDRRQKRGSGRVQTMTDLGVIGPAGHHDRGDLDRIIGAEPTPEFAAEVAEEFGHLLDTLGDESLRLVALGRLEGYTNDEIAARLGCARRTVARRLDLIRRTWIHAWS